MEKKRGHVLVLTYPSQGHLNPLIQFSKRLASKGLKVTLATTHYTLKSIHVEGIGVEPISDGYDDGGFMLAPSVDAYTESFKTVGSRTLAEVILKFHYSSSPVGCLVYDSLLPWALDVARQHGIYGAAFFTNSATVCSLYWYVQQGLLALPLRPEATSVSLPGIPSLSFSDLPSFLSLPASYSAYLAMIMDQLANLERNDWVLGNTFEELEGQVAETMSKLRPVTMIGPMVPSAYLDQRIEGDTGYGASLWNPNSSQCLRWLGTEPANSVVYVSFGSMIEITADQMEEIAWGLKGTDRHFLWVVKESEQGKLPGGFADLVNGSALLVTWCEQMEVLANQAVGCFVTHCGWNSTLEGLSLGVPMVGLPQWSDQPTNARCVEDVWGVGVKAKADEKGVVRREELEMCIREVMEGQRSQEIKRNAMKWRELAKKTVSEGGSSDKNINEFVGKLNEL